MKKNSLLICFTFISVFAFSQWTWQNPLPQGNTLLSVRFTDISTGFTVGEHGTILKTNNGGISWNTQMSGTTMDLHSVFFTNSNTGYIVGSLGTILKTSDAGTTWTELSSGTTESLYSVYFTDTYTGYAVGGSGYNEENGIILKTINGGTTWNILLSGTIKKLHSVFFTDALNGYVVGGSGSNSENTIILKTINGGTTWTTSLAGQYNQLNSVFFTNTNTGYAVGAWGTILKTTNGGTNWTVLQSDPPDFLFSVYFTDANTGYAVGGPFYPTTTIFKTTNGGTTWSALPCGTIDILKSVYYPNTNTGYAVGNNGTIVKTNDGGATWTYLSSGTTFWSLTSINFPDKNNGYATGFNYNSQSGLIFKTINGGNNWTNIWSGPSIWLNSVYFPDPNIGYVSGYDNNNQIGVIFKTSNGGTSWTILPTGMTTYLNSVYFTDVSIGYVVGDSGTILKTINGGTTWTKQSSGTTKRLSSVHFPNTDTGYAVGNTGTILKTNNGGTTWTSLINDTVNDLISVYFSSANIGFAVGGDFNTFNGIILKTTDGGATWTTSYHITNDPLWSVYFPEVNTGYAISSFGNVIKTNDGGTSWNTLSSGTSNQLYSVYFTDINTGYIVGDGGAILKTTNGGGDFNLLFISTNYVPNPNETITFSGKLTDENNTGIANTTIGIEDPIAMMSTTIMTDANGAFSFQKTIPTNAAGIYSFVAKYQKLKVIVNISPKIQTPESLLSHQAITNLITSTPNLSQYITDGSWGAPVNLKIYSQISALSVNSSNTINYPVDNPSACAQYSAAIQKSQTMGFDMTYDDQRYIRYGSKQFETLAKKCAVEQHTMPFASYILPGIACVAGGVETGGFSCFPLAWQILADWDMTLINNDKRLSQSDKNYLSFLKTWTANVMAIYGFADLMVGVPSTNAIYGLASTTDDIETIREGEYSVLDNLKIYNSTNGHLELVNALIVLPNLHQYWLLTKTENTHYCKIESNSSQKKQIQNNYLSGSTVLNADIHIYNSAGQHTGRNNFKLDSLDNNVPNVFHSGLLPNIESAVIVYPNDTYTISLSTDSIFSDSLRVTNFRGDSILYDTVIYATSTNTNPFVFEIKADTGIVNHISLNVKNYENRSLLLHLYPNPSNDFLNIESNQNNSEISIYNITGQLLIHQKMLKQKTIIDINSLIQGLYVVKLKNNKGISVAKFVKE